MWGPLGPVPPTTNALLAWFTIGVSVGRRSDRAGNPARPREARSM